MRAIRSRTGLTPEIKWPNDLAFRGKKIAGILTEMSAELDRVKYVILGIGVDVNLSASEFPSDLRKSATSLRIETGETLNRAGLAAEILRELDRDYTRIGSGQFTHVVLQELTFLSLKGQVRRLDGQTYAPRKGAAT